MYHVVRTRIHCSQCRLQSIISIYACFFERFMATHTRPKRQRFAGSYNERQPQAAPSGLDYSQTSLSATIGTAKCITTDEAEALLSEIITVDGTLVDAQDIARRMYALRRPRINMQRLQSLIPSEEQQWEDIFEHTVVVAKRSDPSGTGTGRTPTSAALPDNNECQHLPATGARDQIVLPEATCAPRRQQQVGSGLEREAIQPSLTAGNPPRMGIAGIPALMPGSTMLVAPPPQMMMIEPLVAQPQPQLLVMRNPQTVMLSTPQTMMQPRQMVTTPVLPPMMMMETARIMVQAPPIMVPPSMNIATGLQTAMARPALISSTWYNPMMAPNRWPSLLHGTSMLHPGSTKKPLSRSRHEANNTESYVLQGLERRAQRSKGGQ